MVHGNYYGVQYEIYLNKQLNLFDDVLPICIDVRKMISLEHNKLVIIPYRELDKRFEKREHVIKYMESMDEISYNYKITRKTNPELFKYQDVKNYTNYIKYSELPEPYTEEHFQKLEHRLEELSSKYNELDYWEKYPSEERKKFDTERSILIEVLRVQRIIRNKEYFNKIKQIEQELTDIELTDGEKELINKVLSHPKLKGSIYFHGINLIEGFF